MTGRGQIVHILSVSGGKDSTAAGLHLREQRIPFRAVFFDTGWEAPETYRYLREVVPRALGVTPTWHRRLPALNERLTVIAEEIEAVLQIESDLGPESAMVRWSLRKGMFPSRVRRWCTQEMKVYASRDVMNAAVDAGEHPINVLGIRAEESAARSGLPEREIGSFSAIWRPILHWSFQQVVDIHARHNVTPNPLYLREAGANRVGCWPCIQCGKAELRLLTKDERRVRALELLERHVETLAQDRARALGRRARPLAFFQGHGKDRVVELCPECDGTGEVAGDVCGKCDGQGSVRRIPVVPIRKMLEWAQTAHGGRQMLLGLPEQSGCLTWGLCDLSAEDK